MPAKNFYIALYEKDKEDSGKRTAPSAVNWQDIEIYAATLAEQFGIESNFIAFMVVFNIGNKS